MIRVMYEVKTPVEGYTGRVVGVDFVAGVGRTDDEGALAYFERQAYELTPLDDAPPAEEPATGKRGRAAKA